MPGLIFVRKRRARVVDLTYITQASSTTDASTYTFSATSIGTAAADRFVIVGIGSRANAARSISSVTIAGVTATHLCTANDAAGGADMASLYIAAVPTGTTGDIVVTFNNTMLRCAIEVWRMVNAPSATPHATQTDTTLSGAVYSVSIDCPANGAIVGMYWCSLSAGSGSVTWAGIAEDHDSTVESTSNNFSGAHTNFSTTQTGLTVSGTQGGTAANGGLAVASFSP